MKYTVLILLVITTPFVHSQIYLPGQTEIEYSNSVNPGLSLKNYSTGIINSSAIRVYNDQNFALELGMRSSQFGIGASNAYISATFNRPIDFYSGGLPRVRINSTGESLFLNNNEEPLAKISGTNEGILTLFSDGSSHREAMTIQTDASFGGLEITRNGPDTLAMYIDDDEIYVGIGTSTSTVQKSTSLEVNQDLNRCGMVIDSPWGYWGFSVDQQGNLELSRNGLFRGQFWHTNGSYSNVIIIPAADEPEINRLVTKAKDELKSTFPDANISDNGDIELTQQEATTYYLYKIQQQQEEISELKALLKNILDQ